MAAEIAGSHCYCNASKVENQMFTCSSCKKLFHISCLKSGKPSELAGDVYFRFTCKNCSEDGAERFKRIKLPWTTVLILALYNLQLQGGGKCGFFRWREHVCKFIDRHWATFFGADKKKSATWHGTVAGCLSNGANKCFLSGAEVLKENGWWSLRSTVLPSIEEVEAALVPSKVTRKRKVEESLPIVEGSRRRHSNVLEAALSLKEKKVYMDDEAQVKSKKRKSDFSAAAFSTSQKLKCVVPKVEPLEQDSDYPRSIPKIIIKTERNVSPKLDEDLTSHAAQESDDVDLGVSSDLQSVFDVSGSLDLSDSSHMLDDLFSENSCEKNFTKYESDEDSKPPSKSLTGARKMQHQHPSTSRKKKAVVKEENPVKETIVSDSKYTMMSLSEEAELLRKLENCQSLMRERPELRRLYRKLIVRKLKREKNIPVFDIDAEVRAIRGLDPPEYLLKDDSVKEKDNGNSAILDRYQLVSRQNKSSRYSSFITRLMGLQDEQYDSIVSPYTERILKPFIFRDCKTKPMKLKLLEEVVAHRCKSDVNFVPPKSSPVDYCYVRPQHIPAINSLCCEFFWPGIDLSESLQYPDFSCVALYKKIIIGFAFMVPDVKYNEAYITFIFCHPEWRRAGIATFMLYHLIQTCMGKDVTLHVSAASSAVFLYQKFGFKVEEFIHGFYDKYLPPESKECRHALFMRLNR